MTAHTRLGLLGTLAAVSSLASGCIVNTTPPPVAGYPPPPPPGGPPQVVVVGAGGPGYFTLVLDFVDLSATFGGGPPPDTYVTALVAGTGATSSTVFGDYTPQFNEPLIDADEASFETGIDLQVWADDGTGPALAGEINYAPIPDDFGGAPVLLGAFDYVTGAQVHFEPR